MSNDIIIKDTDLISTVAHTDLSDLIKPLVNEIHLFDTSVAGTTHIDDETVFDEIKETFNASLYGYDSERCGISKLCNINVMKPLLNLDKYNKYDFFVIGV